MEEEENCFTSVSKSMEKLVNEKERRGGGGAFSFSRVSIEGNIIEMRVRRRCTSRPVGHASLGSASSTQLLHSP